MIVLGIQPIYCIGNTAYLLYWEYSLLIVLGIKPIDCIASNLIKFENSFSNFLTSNNYFQRFLPNKDKFEKLINKMHELIEECFLMDESMLKSKRNRIENPWITSAIIASIKKNDYLYKKWRKSVKRLKNKEGDPSLYNDYKEYRKLLKGVIKCAKKDEIFKKFEKADGNSKETWKIINEIRGKHKARINPSFIINEVIVEERRAIANGFNSYFTTISSNDCDDGILIEPLKKFNDFIGCSVESSIYLTDFSPDEIKKIICDFSSNKASVVQIFYHQYLQYSTISLCTLVFSLTF